MMDDIKEISFKIQRGFMPGDHLVVVSAKALYFDQEYTLRRLAESLGYTLSFRRSPVVPDGQCIVLNITLTERQLVSMKYRVERDWLRPYWAYVAPTPPTINLSAGFS